MSSTTNAPATKAAKSPGPRTGTKQALLIEMLRRPDGATIEQIVKATGWQPHTVRGAIAGGLRGRLRVSTAGAPAGIAAAASATAVNAMVWTGKERRRPAPKMRTCGVLRLWP